MDVDSRENGFEELGGFPKEDGSTLAAEYDLSFVVNKEVNDENYVNDGLASCNEFQDCNEQVQQVPPSSDLRSHEIFGLSPANFHSPPQAGFDSDVFPNKTSFVGDQVRLRAPSINNHHEAEADVSVHPQKLPLIENSNQEDEMEDSPPSPPHDKTVTETVLEPSKYESTESEFAFNEVEDEVSDIKTEKLYSSLSSRYGNNESKRETIICSRNSPDESKKLEVLHSDQYNIEVTPQLSTSPGTVRQVAVTPDISHGVSKQGFQEPSYSSRSHGKENCFSPERSDLGKEASKDNLSRAGRKNRDSPQRKRQGSPHLDNASVECVFLSPRNHGSHQKHRRRDRSVSRSPVRRRDSSSVHKRDHRNRSRSRSPYKRDHRRRSPRRRYSPRRRSPSGYQSYRRSPKRRHWSPPHDRSTGLGKPGRDLFVAGFNFLTTERDLERKFARFGRVGDVRIVRDKRSGDSRGFGFLSLERDEEADAAIRALDKTQWNGRIVLVEKSKSH